MGGRTLGLAALAALSIATAAVAAPAPNDEHWNYQWGPRQIDAPHAWQTSTGAGQRIAIVDSGVDIGHPDLRNKIADGATFVGCARDRNGCGNGDWESGPGPGDPHGTHVAGSAAASTENLEGIAGVAPRAKLLAVKVLDDEGASFEEVAAGVRWSVDHGADVVNLSLGALPGVQAFELTGLIGDLRDAVRYARRNGAVVVAAAGNDYASICGSPAFNRGALCVVATDRQEAKASYSNFAANEELDVVAAPGGAAFLACTEDIISTWPIGANDSCEQSVGTRNYNFIAGTSMATPHVAGGAALLTAQGRSAEQTINVLERTARTPPANTRGTYTPVYGFGIIDLDRAVAFGDPPGDGGGGGPGGPGGGGGGPGGGGGGPDGGANCDDPTIEGTAGRDNIRGTPGSDVIAGRAGNDEIRGLGGADRICGNDGDDRLFGGDGDDALYGGPGRDELHGGDGEDFADGGQVLP